MDKVQLHRISYKLATSVTDNVSILTFQILLIFNRLQMCQTVTACVQQERMTNERT